MRSDRIFRSRIVLLNRDSVLSETDPLVLAEEHAFRILLKDNVATNPAVQFSIETFEPTADFQPSKPFVSRLIWRDRDGNTQSKLLLTDAQDLIATTVRGEVTPPDEPVPALPLPRSRRKRATLKASQA